MSKRLASFYIVRDTREKENQGWVFPAEEKEPGKTQVLGTEEDTLESGDYAIKGHLDLVAIERKRGWGELFGNYSPSEHRERFEREMDRLKNVKHKFILVETSLMNDSLGLTIPQYKFQGPPASRILSWLTFLELEYGVNVEFVGDAGVRRARIIFDNIARKYL